MKFLLPGRLAGILFLSILSVLSVKSQVNIPSANRSWEWQIAEDGTVRRLIFHSKADTIPFFDTDKTAGPSFYMSPKGGHPQDASARWHPVENSPGMYRSVLDQVECTILYPSDTEYPVLTVTLTNLGRVPVQPGKMGLKMGLDTYMDVYPQWFGKYFPTFMRNESTHFWGYLQSPAGKILGIASAQPVASWSTDFSLGYRSDGHWFWGHRIESLNLDLINTLPLPERHPQDLWQLRAGERKSWEIVFFPLNNPEELEYHVSRFTEAPALLLEKTVYRPGEKASLDVISFDGKPQVTVTNDAGQSIRVETKAAGKNRYRTLPFQLPTAGIYTVRAVNEKNKVAEGIVGVRHNWQWYLERAREGAWEYHQKATSHIESWMGFYSAFLAARYFPEPSLDTKLEERFELLFDTLHELDPLVPRYFGHRIQNTAGTIGMLVDKYQAYGRIDDLERAASLADWLIETWQWQNGAYYNHGIIYTSVIYIAKSILELAEAERALIAEPRWKERFDRHYLSAKRAIDQLVDSRGDFQTEGEHTFEDGMISCSALQIGLLALWQDDPAERDRYTRAMLEILSSHDCLTQLRVPDARRRGGTMRFWEAQYDVLILPNMFNSPHGWSAWRGYATYYAYLLTGEERWLTETFNAMGAFANLIDPHTGTLRWAFVIDPYVRAEQASRPDTTVTFDTPTMGNPHPRNLDPRPRLIGEEYIGMVSDWQPVNTQDNDVHEVFKLIGEAALTNAFVIERPDGQVIGYNCRVVKRGKNFLVTPDESQISRVHFNLRGEARAVVEFGSGTVNAVVRPMRWLDHTGLLSDNL